MNRLGLTFLFVSITILVFGQETKWVKNKISNNYIEQYEVLVDDSSVKNGNYFMLAYSDTIVNGYYSENKKDGYWKYDSYYDYCYEGSYENDVKVGSWNLIYKKKKDSIRYVYIDTLFDEAFFLGNDYDFNQAKFKGGNLSLLKHLGKNINYPAIAQENNVQGYVYVSFNIYKDKNIGDFKILKSLGSGCDAEAIRALELTKKNWIIPDNLVSVIHTIRIKFTLY